MDHCKYIRKELVRIYMVETADGETHDLESRMNRRSIIFQKSLDLLSSIQGL